MSAKLPERLTLDRLPTPVGEAVLVTDEDGRLRAFHWDDHEDHVRAQMRRHYGITDIVEGHAPAAIRTAIEGYFAGDLDRLSTIEWRIDGGTAFQTQVWNALATIPVGQTLSYGGLAVRIGNPSAVRAVGMANGANPIGLVLPCHRVIGTNGTLTGYGGGLHRKRWLLEHEGAAFRLQ